MDSTPPSTAAGARKLTIALVSHDVIKGLGQGRVNYEIVEETLRNGHFVTVVAARLAPELASHPRLRWVRVGTGRLRIQVVQDLWFGLRAARWLRRLRREVDTVVTNGASTWADSDVNVVHFVHSAWLKSAHHVSRVHRGPYGVYQWLYSRIHAALERVALFRARVVVAISEQVRRELLELGVPPERIELIPNGVDADEFKPGRVDRAAFGLPDHATLGLFVGDIRSPRKNLELVLRALPDVPEMHMAVVGEVSQSPYPEMARRLRVADRVHFLGYRRDVPAVMQVADMFVFPSHYEANALVLLEALAAGLPIVATRTGGAEMLVTPECGVLLDDASDAAAMAAALERISKNPNREAMQMAAREQGLRYSWKEMTRRYLELFERLAPEGAQAGGNGTSPIKNRG